MNKYSYIMKSIYVFLTELLFNFQLLELFVSLFPGDVAVNRKLLVFDQI